MKVLVVNNYYKEEYRDRAEEIEEVLRKCGVKNIELIDFREISKFKSSMNVNCVILSGSTAHLYNSEHLAMYQDEIEFIHSVNVPTLGVCFGHQLIAKAFGADVKALSNYVRGLEDVEVIEPNHLFSTWKRGEKIRLHESHMDYVVNLPKNFIRLAKSKTCEIEAMKHKFKPIYGIQAHIERAEEQSDGLQVLKNFIQYVLNSQRIEYS